jgi:thiol-disulfide isomerase/thioredoxin
MLMRSLVAVFLLTGGLQAQAVLGDWDASLSVKDTTVPFRLTIEQSKAGKLASFWNGEQKVTSSPGQQSGQELVFRFPYYATELHLEANGNELKGEYGSTAKGFDHLTANRATKIVASHGGSTPQVAGEWRIPVNSPKGEKSWRLLVRQKGDELSAAILRVDGDTGSLTGRYKDGKFVLGHFSGARAARLEIEPGSDPSVLTLAWYDKKGRQAYTAVRAQSAKAQDIAAPSDPAEHTTVKDPAAPFEFRAKDLAGHLVTNQDARFHDKVVVVNIMGSWCPNCHDEAPFLEDLYRKFHSRGLEVVSLDFEEAGQFDQPDRLKAFIQRYRLDYTVLLAGKPDELSKVLPQAVNLNAWPTTFFLGRDGRVRAVHAGFAAQASGEFHERLKADITSTVQRLLSESALAASR